MGGRVATVLVVTSVAACGRFGFDARANDVDAAGGGPDADPSAYVISSTQLTSSSGNSFVDLEVDWARSLAYIGTREAGHCFEVVDFAADPPVFLARLGPPDTGGSSCLGVHLLEAGLFLAVTIEPANLVELWQLGPEPRAGTHVLAGSAAITKPRRIVADSGEQNRLYVARGAAAPGFQIVGVSFSPGPSIVAGPGYDSGPCPDNHNEAASLGSGLVISACSTDLSPIELVDDQTLFPVGSVPMAPPTAGVSGFWATARDPDGQLAVVLGWVGAVIQTTVAAPRYVVRSRFDNDNGYRGATWGQAGTRDVYAARNDGSLELLSVAELAAPRVVRHAPLGAPGEPYDVAVEPGGTRAIVITNGGTFLIVDTTKLPAADIAWPTF